METNNTIEKIVIFGGNGFVGCKVAELLSVSGARVVCVSRKGTRPVHLQSERWADNIDWIKGDASDPDPELLKDCTALVCLVGSPPIPAVGKRAYAQQVFTNGITNSRAIKAAGDAGIKRIVLLGAKIPTLLDKDWFGYAKGKRLSIQALKDFAQLSKNHHAVIIQPGGIFGKRHSVSGSEIPIDIVMRPLSKVLYSQLISLERVAGRIAKEAHSDAEYQESLKIVTHNDI
jgi:uncharacterized protein YbjT (DUF2867 family)